jgi:succinoglycan biosynthesis transport protein ExoP
MSTSDEPSTAEEITNVLGVVRRQIIVVIVLWLIGGIFGAIYFIKSTPNFTAVATLLINTRKMEIVQQPAVSDELPMQAAGAVESRVELLRSDEVALRVINKLNLAEDTRFTGADHQSLFQRLLHRFAPEYYADSLGENERQNLALRVFDAGLTVERVGATYAIEIKFQSGDPELAAKVANAVAEAYIDLQRTSEYNAARQAGDWLEERIPDLRAKSEAAQKAVVEYKQEHNIVETGTGELIQDQRLTDITARLNTAHDETIKAKDRADQLAVLMLSGFQGALASEVNSGKALPELLEKLRIQYVEVTSKVAESSGKLGANNPTIVGLRNQAAQLRSAIIEEIQSLKQSSESDYAAAQVREANLKKDFDLAVAQAQAAKKEQVKLRELDASAHAYQDLYTTYISRYNASLQQAASPIAEASVITPATSLIERDYKKAIRAAVFFQVAGVIFGLGVALLRETLASRVFLTSKSVQSRLHIGCVGLIPKVRGTRRRSTKSQGGLDARTLVRGDRGVAWTVVDRPLSQFSEGVRSIKLAIDLANRSRSSRIVGITSAIANEGKSTVALALAQMIASNGASVVLVDCDLRNPSLTRSTAPNAASGIIELAFSQASLENVVWSDQSTGMAFLPAIPRAAPPDPPSLLSSAEMRQFFDRLRECYQFVIVDLPPLVPVVDVCATIELVEAFVLVIEWGQTTVDLVKRSLRAVPLVSESIIGAVLNKTDVKRVASYDPYVTGYYFDHSDRR